MNTATADGARALYGIARDDMTVKQLYQLNRYRVPSRAMTVDMLVNLFLVFFVGNTLAILVAGNLGYILAHILALSGFLLLRKDRPNWPRPIRAGDAWVTIAGILIAANVLFLIFGITNPDITGYGTFRDLLIGVGVLLISVLLFIFRRVVQDGHPIVLREETPAMPPARVGGD
jgi:amino acid transporter